MCKIANIQGNLRLRLDNKAYDFRHGIYLIHRAVLCCLQDACLTPTGDLSRDHNQENPFYPQVALVGNACGWEQYHSKSRTLVLQAEMLRMSSCESIQRFIERDYIPRLCLSQEYCGPLSNLIITYQVLQRGITPRAYNWKVRMKNGRLSGADQASNSIGSEGGFPETLSES